VGRKNAGSIPVTALRDEPREEQPGAAAHDGERDGLGEHEREQLAIGEAEGLHHGELVRALAHGLRHRVAGDQ
jgi:hypothetical protein